MTSQSAPACYPTGFFASPERDDVSVVRRKLAVCKRALFLALALVAFIPTAAFGQFPDSVSASAKISLITVTPGTLVYNVFGHSAIRVFDPAQDFDVLFNYGTFDVTPTFVPDFIRGKLDYSLSVSNTNRSLLHYRNENRSVIEQQLDLTHLQTKSLYRFLVTNYLPENRFYRYDFFFDNCSTRIRDAFQVVLGDSLSMEPSEHGDSFRDLLHEYLERRPFLAAGIDLIIGSDADRTASESERAFLPLELERQLYGSRIGNRPMVSVTDTLYVATPTTTGLPAVWVLSGWVVFLVILVVSARNRNQWDLRRLDASLFFVSGLAGLAILLLWFATDHVVTDANLNLAWTLPTNMILGIALLAGRGKPWMRVYLIAYAIILAVLLLGWAFWYQDLPDLLMPVVALLLLRTVGRVVYNSAEHQRN